MLDTQALKTGDTNTPFCFWEKPYSIIENRYGGGGSVFTNKHNIFSQNSYRSDHCADHADHFKDLHHLYKFHGSSLQDTNALYVHASAQGVAMVSCVRPDW